jgi:hypothetical protein
MPDGIKSTLKGAGNLIGTIKHYSGRVAGSTQQSIASALKGDPEAAAKSFKEGGKVDEALAPLTSHPLGKDPNGVPKKSIKGEAPPGKAPTTEMPNTPGRAAARWEKVKPYLAGGGLSTILAGVGVGTWLAVAGVHLQNTDGVEVKITKIQKVKDTQNQYKFSYDKIGGQKCGSPPIACIQSAFKPCKDDTFTFRGTRTTPTLNDVTALVIEVDENAVYFELDLTDIGNGTPDWGFMTCHTSFENQFRGSIRDAVKLVADIASDVALPVLGGFCDAIPIPFICPDAFRLGNWTLWVIIVCLLLCCLVIVYLLFS